MDGGKMKNYITLNYKRIIAILVLVLMIGGLSGCSSTYDNPLNGFSDETNLFGWFLVWPIAWLMSTIGNFFNGSFGIALIITTFLVRLISWPIYAGTTNTMFKMQLAQPDINRVQAKYAGRTDEVSKRKMSAEMQSVYKKHGFNPLGCIFIVFQFPIFSAMYTVINRITVEEGSLALTNFNFLGFDLTGGLLNGAEGGFGPLANQIFTGVLVAMVVGTMFLSQHLSRKKPSYQKNIPNKNPNAKQQESTMKMMMIMSPLLMGFMASQSTGLALYWVVGNSFQLLQTIVVRKMQEKKYNKLNNIV